MSERGREEVVSERDREMERESSVKKLAKIQSVNEQNNACCMI